MEKIILGLSLGFNSSACIYSDERGLLAAISQERVNSEKNTKELPLLAALKCCKIARVYTIDQIAISHYEHITDRYFERYGKEYNLAGSAWKNKIISFLIQHDILVKNTEIVRIDHHVAHGFSTFAFYGHAKTDDYVITSDGFGDGVSAAISRVGYGGITSLTLENSTALIYQFVTGALGYKEHQHEGKITGLAAFGKPKYLAEFENINIHRYSLTEEEIEQVMDSAIIGFDKFLLLKKAVYGLVEKLLSDGAEPKDIATTVQEFAEIHTLEWIKTNVLSTGHNCYLAGGLFANVKINQRIKDMGIFKNVYVSPAMGDEGTAVGAAIAASGKNCPTKISPNKCGTIADETIIGAKMSGHKITRIESDEELATAIASRLANNKIVCLVKDEMEFGPRALCHRSILYNCDTKETNNWLNDKLGRTEFMPFAPVIREEVADDLFKNLDGGRDSAKYMAMTFNCTDEFIQNYPAACHIDNTARPQIVSKNEDPFIWSVLDIYQNITGKKALINTSFNLHNNPIIESTVVAVSSWLTSDTDVLVIGNTMIEKA